MDTIVLRLDPARLTNPDLDLRYVLPKLLAERSNGLVTDDGYDYTGGEPPFLVLFLKAVELEPALACIQDVIENLQVLDNSLCRAVTVAIRRGECDEVVYPPGFVDQFLPD
jgi:hypothetical protein